MARKIKASLLSLDTSNAIVGSYTGSDNLVGTDAGEALIGYGGADTMTGGGGADTFVIAPGYLMTNDGWWFSPDRDGERDTITDFTSGEDKIDISGIWKNIDTDGDQRSEIYRVTWADVEIEAMDGGVRVHVHQVAGDTQWDMGIDVLGVSALTEADFVFA